jgi:YggT family protein
MLTQSLIFLLESLGQLWILAVLLRFFAQTMRASFRARAGNPLADFIMALTDWAVTPSRRIFPSVFRLDTASIAVAWVATALLSLSVLLLSGLMIVQAILSWLNPYHPLQPFFHTMTRSILKPVQNLIPLIGGVDLSPLFVILLLQVLLIGPLAFLGIEAARLMNWMPR